VREALALEDAHQIIELAMEITADNHRSRQMEEHWLRPEDASNFVEEAVYVLEMGVVELLAFGVQY